MKEVKYLKQIHLSIILSKYRQYAYAMAVCRCKLSFDWLHAAAIEYYKLASLSNQKVAVPNIVFHHQTDKIMISRSRCLAVNPSMIRKFQNLI